MTEGFKRGPIFPTFWGNPSDGGPQAGGLTSLGARRVLSSP